jgi:hypothetical protein
MSCRSSGVPLVCFFSPVRPGLAFNQRSNQVQKRLMLGISLSSAQKCADIHIGLVAA